MKRFVGASVAVAAVLAIVGGLTMTGASAAPAVDVRLVSSSVRNLDTLAPQGGTRSEFRVTLKNFGAQKVFITLKADRGYDYARPFHALLERVGSGWFVRDLGSHNGTFLNGTRVERSSALRDGDCIGIGGWRAVFRDDSDTDSAITEQLTPVAM